jgi:hypothetical protein
LGEYSFGTAINLTPVADHPPALASSRVAGLTVSVRPSPALTIDSTYLWTELSGRDNGSAIFNDQLVRSRWNYQITRRLSVRAIARYHHLSVEPRATALMGERAFNVDLLATYFVQPGTAIYVGWNSDRRRFANERSEQIFVKISYGLQF